jgi:hypothetical protein
VGRQPKGMLGLAALLLVRQATGSLGPAGTTAATLLLGQAVGGIAQTRLVDRTRQTPPLVVCGLLHPALLVLLTVGAARHAPVPLLAMLTIARGRLG